MKVWITTIPFGEKNPLPIEQLEAAGIEYLVNPLNRKLNDGYRFIAYSIDSFF